LGLPPVSQCQITLGFPNLGISPDSLKWATIFGIASAGKGMSQALYFQHARQAAFGAPFIMPNAVPRSCGRSLRDVYKENDVDHSVVLNQRTQNDVQHFRPITYLLAKLVIIIHSYVQRHCDVKSEFSSSWRLVPNPEARKAHTNSGKPLPPPPERNSLGMYR
jgi:hypothetical protein